MKKGIISLIAAGGLALPLPAAAQTEYSSYPTHHNQMFRNEGGDYNAMVGNQYISIGWDCAVCHTGDGVTGSWAFASERYLCEDCHTNTTGADFSLISAPAVEIHPAGALGNDFHGSLGRGCGSCHTGSPYGWSGVHPKAIDPDNPPATPALAEGIYEGTAADPYGYRYDPFSDTSTFRGLLTINDPDWGDISRWNRKSGPERGLILEITRTQTDPRRVWYAEIVDVANNTDESLSITVKGEVKWDVFAPYPGTGELRVFYGQEILSRIYVDRTTSPYTASPVRFLSPRDAADNDGLGPGGGDASPDGICQVCHTTTSYWRADGSGTDHNAGGSCLVCHEHERGFAEPLIMPSCDACHAYPPARGETDSHGRHSRLGFDCATCHQATTVDGVTIADDTVHNNGVFDVVAASSFTGRAGEGGQVLDFVYTPATGGGSCASNTCHAYWGFSDPVQWNSHAEVVVSPRISGLASPETDRVVSLDASRSSCYEVVDGVNRERTCSYQWDFGGSGAIVGGNGSEVMVYRYDAAGDYTVSLAMEESRSGKRGVESITVGALEVELPPPSADFTTTLAATTVTLAASLPSEVVRVYVYWGDRRRSVSTDPAGLALSHTYERGGRDYNIRVTTIDSDHNRLSYTFGDDPDLRVTLP